MSLSLPLEPTVDGSRLDERAPRNWRTFLLAFARGFTTFGWIAVVVACGLHGTATNFGLGTVLDFLALALAGFLFVALFDGLATLLWKLLNFVLPRVRLGRLNEAIQAVPAAILGRAVGILLMIFGNVLWPESFFQFITLPLPGKVIALTVAVGGGLWAISRIVERPAWRWAGAIVAAAVPLAVLVWLLLPGTDDYLVRAAPGNPAIATPDFDNPGLPGPFAVHSLSYGSGDNRHRPEYGTEAALTTPVVDGSAIYGGYHGFSQGYFEWYNGFDFASLPLNGLVWYPEGDGPFPLVLIVHGNHAMAEPSDPGYAYLGEHLASRGMIAVSVDENFLNGHAFEDPSMAEIPLRAWLLLKHLEAWRAWNATPGNPFYGQVDLERVALIGHSRGGEAVAHAAEMNAHPTGNINAATGSEPFGFGIQGVVAIAPCDSRYKPAGQALALRNADYLLLAGGHDGDMNYLDGLGQYNRTTFSENPDGFKALAYLYRANHGNFNTVWGDADQGRFESLALNRKPLLSTEEQQQAAKVLITGFLEASLNDREAYRSMFYSPAAVRDWLPEDIVVTQYQDAGFTPVMTNDGGDDSVLSAKSEGVQAEGITSTKMAFRELRNGDTIVRNRGTVLEWTAGQIPSYSLLLPPAEVAKWALTADDALSFTLASVMDGVEPGAIEIELTSANGATARRSLADFGPVPPSLPAKLAKAEWVASSPGIEMTLATPYEQVDQTFDLPLAAFVAVNADFDPARLSTITFLFDGAAAGKMRVDEIGFRTTQP
jgi:dienelactone hydrolase